MKLKKISPYIFVMIGSVIMAMGIQILAGKRP